MARTTSHSACPICRKPVAQAYRPFCSKRCADVDLGRWLGGRYAIPAEEPLSEADLEAVVSNDNAPD
ncbi:MAG: DNA gyrase inhibitor YacG [Alphaproteobacteria bacterium]